jgi:4'-phosphopantetheinyl transferase EntD
MNTLHLDQHCTVYVQPIDSHDDLPRRQAEREAVAHIVRTVFGNTAAIDHDENGAPRLTAADFSGYISITHSRRYAAVAIDYRAPIGLDIEEPRQQLGRVAPRVLSAAEMAVYSATPEGLLQAWTLKEALYKAALTPGLDFREQIALPLDPGTKKARVTVPSTKTVSDFDIIVCSRLADLCPGADAAWLSVVRLIP